MNEIAKPTKGPAALPVQVIDGLAGRVRELADVEREVRWLERDLEEQCLSRELPELPKHAERTIAEAAEMSKPPKSSDIIDALSILAGVYGARGDASIVARVGVPLIEAERPSRMALYQATLALLRPIPSEGPSMSNNFQDFPPTPRKYAPTLSELIVELRERQENWKFVTSNLEVLPELHAEVRKQLGEREGD